MRPRVVVLGFVCRDTNTIENGTKIDETGGKGWYTSIALSRCGIDVELITWLPEGDLELVEPLRELGIGVHILPIAESIHHENVHVPAGHRERSAHRDEPIDPKNITPEMWSLMEMADAVLIAPDNEQRLPPEILEGITDRLGTKLIGDLAHYLHEWDDQGTLINRRTWPNESRIVRHFDMVFLSANDVHAIQHEEESHLSYARRLAEQGPSEVIITRSGDGSFVYLHDENDAVETPAFPPKAIVDRTGAGDTFAGAYLAQRLLGTAPERAAAFAAMAASMKLGYSGPLKETAEEVETALREHEEHHQGTPKK